MTRRRPERGRYHTLARASLLLALPLVFLASCEKEAPPPPRQTYVPPPPPPLAPLEELPMDPRVQFPQSREPSTRELAEAIADLASAIVSGDDATLEAVLDDNGKRVLTELKDAGLWSTATAGIEAVRICVLNETEGGARCDLGLGIQDNDGAYLLAWSGTQQGDSWSFAPKPVDNLEAPQVAMLDDASIIGPALPSPREFEVDPDEERFKPMERFSK